MVVNGELVIGAERDGSLEDEIENRRFAYIPEAFQVLGM